MHYNYSHKPKTMANQILISDIKTGSIIKCKYGYIAKVYYNDGKKIDAQFQSKACFTYNQNDLNNGEFTIITNN